MSTLATLILCGASLTAAASPTQADDPVVQLPASSYSRMLVDEAHGHVLITTGKVSAPTQALLVYDLNGNLLKTVSASYLSTPSGMMLSADGSLVYVATSYAILAYDAQTLDYRYTVHTDDTLGLCGTDMAMAGGKFWFTRMSYLYTYPPNCATQTEVFYSKGSDGVYTRGFWTLANLRWAAGPQLPNTIVAADTYGQNSYVREFDATTTAPTETSLRTYSSTSTTPAPVPKDLALSADGKQVAIADGASGFRLLNTSDLSDSAQGYGPLPAGTVATSVAYSRDGTLVARGAAASGNDADLLVQSADPAQTGTTREYVFNDAAQGGDRVAERGLAFTHDGSRLYAITTNSTGSAYWLRVLNHPGMLYAAHFDGPLTVTPSSPVVGEALKLSGRLQLDGPAPVQPDQVTAVRKDADGTHQLTPVTVAADGTFTFKDTPSDVGTAEYIVSFAGDPSHTAAQDVTLTVTVIKAPTKITLTPPADAAFDTGVHITGTLAARGPALPAGLTLQVQRSTKKVTGTLTSPMVHTDGAFVIDDLPEKTDDYTYTVSYPGDALHDASSATVTVHVHP